MMRPALKFLITADFYGRTDSGRPNSGKSVRSSVGFVHFRLPRSHVLPLRLRPTDRVAPALDVSISELPPNPPISPLTLPASRASCQRVASSSAPANTTAAPPKGRDRRGSIAASSIDPVNRRGHTCSVDGDTHGRRGHTCSRNRRIALMILVCPRC